MADSEIIRRLIEQAGGQGGPAFATAMPQMTQGSGAKLDGGMGPLGLLPPPTQGAMDAQTGQMLQGQMSPPTGRAPADTASGRPIRQGLPQGEPRPPRPEGPPVNASEFGHMFDGAGNPIQPEPGTGYNPFSQLSRSVFGDAAVDRATNRPTPAQLSEPDMDGTPRYPGDLGNPVGGQQMGDDANSRMLFDMQAEQQAGLGGPDAYDVPGAAMADTPQPGTNQTSPGSIAGVGGGTPHAAAVQAGIPDPRAPEAFNPDTGTRDEMTRGTGVLDRIFGENNVDKYLGEEGSDRRRNTGKALMMAGATMMQYNGNLGQAIGAGIQAGLTTYDEAMQAIRDEEKEMRQMGMKEEAHELSMELQRLQLQRLRATPLPGSGGGGGGGGGETANLGKAGQLLRDMEILIAAGVDPDDAKERSMGAHGFYPRGASDPMAGLLGN